MKSDRMRAVAIAFCSGVILMASSCSQNAVTGMTDGRARANSAALIGLISAVIAGLAFVRGSGAIGSVIGVATRLVGATLSLIHLTGSTGFGTGGGRLGAIVGLALGLIGVILGGLAFIRSRGNRGTH